MWKAVWGNSCVPDWLSCPFLTPFYACLQKQASLLTPDVRGCLQSCLFLNVGAGLCLASFESRGFIYFNGSFLLLRFFSFFFFFFFFFVENIRKLGPPAVRHQLLVTRYFARSTYVTKARTRGLPKRWDNGYNALSWLSHAPYDIVRPRYLLHWSQFFTPYHLFSDSAFNLGPLMSRWEINKCEYCWYKSVRIIDVLKLSFQQFLNLSSSQRDMSDPKLGALSNNMWSWGFRLYSSSWTTT